MSMKHSNPIIQGLIEGLREELLQVHAVEDALLQDRRDLADALDHVDDHLAEAAEAEERLVQAIEALVAA